MTSPPHPPSYPNTTNHIHIYPHATNQHNDNDNRRRCGAGWTRGARPATSSPPLLWGVTASTGPPRYRIFFLSAHAYGYIYNV